MQKQNSFQFAVIGILAFAVIFMSVGFATYSQVLDINGSLNKFDISLDAESFQEGDGSVEATKTVINDTEINFGAHLAEPGDYYLFAIDIQNMGSIDGLLDAITMVGAKEHESLVDFTVSYDNSEIFTDDAEDLNFAINKESGNNTKPVIVKVIYNPADGIELPAEGIDFDYSIKFDFVQSL